MKRLITFLHSKCRRSVMTLLLLFAALAGVWGSNYVYLWKGNDKNFYKLDDNTQSTSISLEANQTYGFLLTNGNNWDYNSTNGAFIQTKNGSSF